MEALPSEPSPALIHAEHLSEVTPTLLRRNFSLGVINGTLYTLAETILDPTLVLVAFLSNLSASPLLLGAVLPLRDGAWLLPQLWVSGYLQSKSKKLPLYKLMAFIRSGICALIFLSITFVRDSAALIIMFFLLYGIGSCASGVSGLAFLEIVSETIPPRRRGEFYAWRLGMGGLLGIGGSILVRYLLGPNIPFHFPYNFSVLGGLYFLFTTLALILFCYVKEGNGYTVVPKASIMEQLRRVQKVLQTNPTFRSFLIMQITLSIANVATPFFMVYVNLQMGVSRNMIGVYLAAVTVANLLANLLFGRLSLFYGNRLVMTLASTAGFVMSVFVLLLVLLHPLFHLSSTVASIWLVPVFILSGFRNTGIGVSGNSLLLDLAPAEERSLYIGSSNAILGIIILITVLGGMVYMALGFTTLLIFTLFTHGIALVSALYLYYSEGER
jgi:MFS family permease